MTDELGIFGIFAKPDKPAQKVSRGLGIFGPEKAQKGYTPRNPNPAFFGMKAKELSSDDRVKLGSIVVYLQGYVATDSDNNTHMNEISLALRILDESGEVEGIQLFQQLRGAFQRNDEKMRDSLLGQLKRKYPKYNNLDAAKSLKSTSSTQDDETVFTEGLMNAVNDLISTLRASRRRSKVSTEAEFFNFGYKAMNQGGDLLTLGQKIGNYQMRCEAGDQSACRQLAGLRREYNRMAGGKVLSEDDFWNGAQ